jgi:hypothetical protein
MKESQPSLNHVPAKFYALVSTYLQFFYYLIRFLGDPIAEYY